MASRSLQEVQREMLALIRAPEGVAEALRTRGLCEHDLEKTIAGNARLSAQGRLDIYANMYFLRLLEALKETFPKLAIVLDEDDFHALATDYLDACPSRHPSLRYLGQRLPAFMRDPQAPRSRSAAIPTWTADLAALEWARHDLFDAPDAAVVTMAMLGGLPSDAFAGLPLVLVPAQAIIETDHTVETVWRAASHHQAIEPPVTTKRTLLVWRQETSVFHRVIDDEEAALLRRLATGIRFDQVCEQVAEQTALDQAPERAFRLLARWATDGLLAHHAGDRA